MEPDKKSMLWAPAGASEFRVTTTAGVQFGESLCTACGGPGGLRCATCRTPYCSPSCQRAAWPVHKKICKAAAAAALASPPPAVAPPAAPLLAVTPEQLARNIAAFKREAAKYARPPAASLVGNCQLFSAVLEGDEAKVKAFLSFGQDVNGRWECTAREHAAEVDVGDLPPLSLALMRRVPIGIARALIDYGADIHRFARAPGFSLGATPLIAAAYAGNIAGVRLLLSRGADARLPAEGSTMTALNSLEHASESDAVPIAEALLDAGADVDAAAGGSLETALYLAVLRNMPRLGAALLARGASTDIVNNQGMRPFDLAATRSGREWAVKALLKAGASVEPRVLCATATAPGDSNAAAVSAAQRSGKRVKVEGGVEFATSWPFLCVNAGLAASVLPAVLAAAPPAAAKSVVFAVESGPAQRPLLSYAAAHGDAVAMRELLRCGADPNVADAFGHGALWWAVRTSKVACVDALIAAGARPLRSPPTHDAARHTLFSRVTKLSAAPGETTEVNCDETCLAARAAAAPLLEALATHGLARSPGQPCPGCDMLLLQMLGVHLATGPKALPAFLAAVRLGYGAVEGGLRGGLPAALVARFRAGALTQGELAEHMRAREATQGRPPGSSNSVAALCTPLFLVALASATVTDAAGLAGLSTAACALTAAMGFKPGDADALQACVGRMRPAEILSSAAARAPRAMVEGSSPIQLIAEMHEELVMGREPPKSKAAAAQREGLERLMACLYGLGGTPTAKVVLRSESA